MNIQTITPRIPADTLDEVIEFLVAYKRGALDAAPMTAAGNSYAEGIVEGTAFALKLIADYRDNAAQAGR